MSKFQVGNIVIVRHRNWNYIPWVGVIDWAYKDNYDVMVLNTRWCELLFGKHLTKCTETQMQLYGLLYD